VTYNPLYQLRRRSYGYSPGNKPGVIHGDLCGEKRMGRQIESESDYADWNECWYLGELALFFIYVVLFPSFLMTRVPTRLEEKKE
jgi:hypothetical protein